LAQKLIVESREHRQSESHALLKGVNEFLSILSTFIFLFQGNSIEGT